MAQSRQDTSFYKAQLGLPFVQHKLISLWDMKEFIPQVFLANFQELQAISSDIHDHGKGDYPGRAYSFMQRLEPVIKALEEYALLFDLRETPGMCLRFKKLLQENMPVAKANGHNSRLTFDVCCHEIKNILDSFKNDISAIKFAFAPTHKANYFQRDFGPEVKNGLPKADEDIKEAGNCLALDLNTAAVCVLMRVAEHGLRKLSDTLGVTKELAALSDKEDAPSIEYKDWGWIIGKLDEKCPTNVEKTPEVSRVFG